MDLGGALNAPRFNCVAMQYKTLWFLNHLKNKKADDKNAKFLSKLKGWNYSAVIGVCPPIYPQHNAVALWDRGKWDDSQSATLPPIISGAIYSGPSWEPKTALVWCRYCFFFLAYIYGHGRKSMRAVDGNRHGHHGKYH